MLRKKTKYFENFKKFIFLTFNRNIIIENVIDNNDKQMWRDFIKKMDKEYAIWSNMPEDPELN